MIKYLTLLLILSSSVFAQDADSVLNTLIPEPENAIVESTFKSTHLVLLQTNETQKKNDLAFWIGHRFGDIGGEFGGSNTLYGLDVATDIYIGFDYGITDRLTAGFGRSRQNETYNFLAKYKLIQQRETRVPVSVTLFAQTAWITREAFNNAEFSEESDRISHFLQATIAKKFSPSFSLMLNPGILFRQKVNDPEDEKSLASLGIGGRLNFTRRLAIVADYTFVNGFGRSNNLATKYYNPLGVGLEIETGGHVFSLNFQNSSYIIENNFIPDTQKSWSDGGVRFGFAISRNFGLFQRKNKNKDIETKIY